MKSRSKYDSFFFIDESRLPVSIVALVFLIQLRVYAPSLSE